ncbi:MAG: SMC-Scp complex subunit ScpB [Bacteriovorax sp. MedPE-SWde]|nr:MAG: SMC-Scp complex subunit ScpB [Bacteriovorax sp. MedPE-SWde]
MDETQNTHNEEMNIEINQEVIEKLLDTNDEVQDELEAAEMEELEEELVLYPEESDLEYPDEVLKLELDYMDNSLQEDKLWKARTGLNEETICGAIETIVFMSDKPVPLLKIKTLIDEDMPLRVLHEAVARLQKEYEVAHHGIRLQEVAQGYQFRTKATYSKYVQDLLKVNELVLSPTALEVLAIIAYKQPVSKVEVEKIRGVDSSHIVRGLMDKRLVKVAGRSEEVGKPVLYGTTTEFLEVFNLANTDQLPPEHELEEIATQGVGKIEDIRTLVNADLQDRFGKDEMGELEDLSMSIKQIDAETPFTKSLKVEEKKRTKGAEAQEIKTAFDLLEEHLDKTLVAKANMDSFESEVFTAINSPSIISDLTEGPFNIPEDMEEEEEFEMIDLDTGEVIKDEDMDDMIMIDIELEDEEGDIELELFSDDSSEEESELTPEQLIAAQFAEEEVEEKTEEKEDDVEVINILGDGEDEAKNLAAALDDAFAKLLGDGESLLEDSPLDASGIEGNLEEQTDRIVEEAKDLDLDLSFMNNNDLDTSEDNI